MAQPNKTTLEDRINKVSSLLEKSGFNPFERMVNQSIRLATRNDELSAKGNMDGDCEKLEFTVNAELCKYVAPQLKSIEINADISGQVDHGVTVNLAIGNKQAIEAFLGDSPATGQ